MYLPFENYVIVKDGNTLALPLANRHYSRLWKGNTKHNLFVGPGKKMVIVDPAGLWLFVWRFSRYRLDGQCGVECAMFRNESNRLSSEIILEAEKVWDETYGEMRKFTYVNPLRIKSANPGFCFQCAGWVRTNHRSKKGLILLEKLQTNSQEATKP